MGPRKIVLILGNGFDLDLGLKTSYKDFWESDFCPKDYPAPLIQHLNERWGDDLKSVRWYDLESELYNYCIDKQKLQNRHDLINDKERVFLQVFNPSIHSYSIESKYVEAARSLMAKGLLKSLATPICQYSIPYLDDLLHSTVWRDRRALQLIKDGLLGYLDSIKDQDYRENTIAEKVLLAVKCAKESGDSLEVFSFNYTEIPGDYSCDIKDNIHHVHGSCANGRIIIGTKDDINIDSDYDFLQKAFDPHFNPPALVASLLNADDVIVFGHSIGENDRQYLKAFFMQQVDFVAPKQKTITVFTLDEQAELNVKRALQIMTESNLSALYGLNSFSIIKTDSVNNNPGSFEAFLGRYIADKQQLQVAMNQLLDTTE